MRLKAKLLIVLFFLVLLPVGLATWKIQQELTLKQEEFNQELIKERSEESQQAQDLLIPASQELAETLGKTLEQEFRVWDREAAVLARQVYVRHSQINAQKEFLTAYLTEHPGCVKIVVLDRVGVVFNQVPEDKKAIGQDYSDKEYFRSAKDSQQVQTTNQKTKDNGPVYLFSAPTYNSEGKVSGVLTMSVQFQVFFRFLEGVTLGKSGYAVLLDRDGTVLFHKDPEKQFKENWVKDSQDASFSEMVTKMVSGERGHGIAASKLVSGIVAYGPVGGRGLSVGVVVPAEDYLVPTSAEVNESVWASPAVWLPLAMAVLCILIGSFLIVAWLKPWTELLLSASRVAEGELTADFDASRQDEAGIVGKGFATLQGLITQAEEKTEGLRRSLKQSQEEKEWVDEMLTQKTEALTRLEAEFQELKKRSAEQFLLPELYISAQKTPGYKEGCKIALAIICRELKLDRACFFLRQESSDGPAILKRGVGTQDIPAAVAGLEIPVVPNGSIAARSVLQRASYNIQDVLRDSRVGKGELLVLEETQAFIAVPLIYENEVLGVMLADNFRTRDTLSQDTIDHLEGLLPKLGPWLRSALQYDEMTKDVQKADRVKEDKVTEAQRSLQSARIQREAVSNLAADWQVCLNGIKEYIAKSLSSPDPLTESQQEFLGNLVHRSARLERLLADLLEFSKIEGGEVNLNRASVNFVKLVKDCVMTVQSQAEELNIAVKALYSSESVSLVIDEQRVKQALLTLMGAAIKNSPSNSTVSLEVLEGRNDVTFKVTDQGRLLTAGQIEKLFSDFHGPDSFLGSVAASSGVRFPLMKKVMEGHHAQLKIYTEVDKGNVFALVFPKTVQGKAKGEAVPDDGPSKDDLQQEFRLKNISQEDAGA